MSYFHICEIVCSCWPVVFISSTENGTGSGNVSGMVVVVLWCGSNSGRGNIGSHCSSGKTLHALIFMPHVHMFAGCVSMVHFVYIFCCNYQQT